MCEYNNMGQISKIILSLKGGLETLCLNLNLLILLDVITKKIEKEVKFQEMHSNNFYCKLDIWLRR